MAQKNMDGVGKTKTKTSPRMFSTRNDLSLEARQQMIDLLNEVLADLFDLFSQTKQAHWNVKGPEFFQLHELYDDLAETVLGHVDIVAERATALGGMAMGTVRMSAQASRVPEYPVESVDGMDTVNTMAERYAAVARVLREGIEQSDEAGDMDTSDLLIEVSRDVDKALWFIEAHLQGQGDHP